jgi:acetyl-CoA acyltransferase
MSAVHVVDAVRTPIGRFRGGLAAVRPDDLAAHVVRALLERNAVDGRLVDHVIVGATNQAGEDNRNVGRMAALLAGLPDEVPGLTVNRLCGSGLEAVLDAARRIATGDADLVIAGGVESMTRAPFVFAKAEEAYSRQPPQVFDTTIGWRFENPRMAARFPLEGMGETAENVAEKWAIPRDAQDAFALASHRKAVAAAESGAFAQEIVPVAVPQKKGEPVVVARDEGPRADASLASLGKLAPAFRKGGSVTAGNSSTLNDGAAALLLASDAGLAKLEKAALGRIVASATTGVDPRFMGEGPISATRKALARAGWSTSDLDLVELQEAFAAQAIACQRALELDPERVNVRGGAIALGHPIGASGARIVATLLWAMRDRDARRGLASLCVGVGQGMAVLVER